MRAHSRTDGDDPNRRLLVPGPFRDYVIDRFGLVGSPATWKERLSTLLDRGVANVFCAASVPDRDRFISLVGSEVIPAFAR